MQNKKIFGIIISIFFMFFGFVVKVNASEAICHYDFKYKVVGEEYNGYVEISYKNQKLETSYNIIDKFKNHVNDFKISDLIGTDQKLKCKDKVYYAVEWREVYSYQRFRFSFTEIPAPINPDYSDVSYVGSGNLNASKSPVKNDSGEIKKEEKSCVYYDRRGQKTATLIYDNYGNLRFEKSGCTDIKIKFTYQDIQGCPDSINLTELTGAAYGLCSVDFCSDDNNCLYLEGHSQNEIAGSEQTYNGKKCYITSTGKVSTCRDNGYTTYGFKDGNVGCFDGSGNFKKINKTASNFDNTFSDKTKVCPEGFMMSNEYCYNCVDVEGENPGEFTGDCSLFSEITTPIWGAIRIIAPILAVVFGALDFLKATAASDEKEMKKATNDFVKRLIMLALLFLLTYVINFIVGLVGYGSIDACLK